MSLVTSLSIACPSKATSEASLLRDPDSAVEDSLVCLQRSHQRTVHGDGCASLDEVQLHQEAQSFPVLDDLTAIAGQRTGDDFHRHPGLQPLLWSHGRAASQHLIQSRQRLPQRILIRVFQISDHTRHAESAMPQLVRITAGEHVPWEQKTLNCYLTTLIPAGLLSERQKIADGPASPQPLGDAFLTPRLDMEGTPCAVVCASNVDVKERRRIHPLYRRNDWHGPLNPTSIQTCIVSYLVCRSCETAITGPSHAEPDPALRVTPPDDSPRQGWREPTHHYGD
jgi:hypothetical protein